MDDAVKPEKSRNNASGKSGILAADGIRALPSWIVFPMAAIFLIVAYFGFIAPAFQKRAWSVPPPNQLIWRTGNLERSGRTGPYLLTDRSGTTVRLNCNPFIGRYINCLEGAGFPVSDDRRIENVVVGYFVANTHVSHMNIIMSLQHNGIQYLSYASRAKELLFTEQLEDSEEKFPLLDIIFGPLLSIIGIRLIKVKAMQLVRRGKS